jgi:hypothetical protein
MKCPEIKSMFVVSGRASTFSKLHESCAVEWILNDTNDKISESQFGGLAGMSVVLALIF